MHSPDFSLLWKAKKSDATIKRGLTFFANFLANISLSIYIIKMAKVSKTKR